MLLLITKLSDERSKGRIGNFDSSKQLSQYQHASPSKVHLTTEY